MSSTSHVSPSLIVFWSGKGTTERFGKGSIFYHVRLTMHDGLNIMTVRATLGRSQVGLKGDRFTCIQSSPLFQPVLWSSPLLYLKRRILFLHYCSCSYFVRAFAIRPRSALISIDRQACRTWNSDGNSLSHWVISTRTKTTQTVQSRQLTLLTNAQQG